MSAALRRPGPRLGGRAGWSGALLLVLVSQILCAPLGAQIPPDAAWRAFTTPHFRVSYMVGLDSIARAAAARAETAYAVLAREMVEPPRGRIELVIADNVDFTNGYATPLPTNRIVVYAHPPVDNLELAFTTDWLQLVVLHELVHIFHLDTAEGIWRRLRAVFGRNALLFPEAFSPGWLVEGLATYYESRLTQAGRVRGTLFEMALRTAALEDELFSIDRASGDPVLWPAGNTRYIYGSLFLEHLARREGAERIPEFVERYGRQLVPYRLDAVARRTFGASFTRAWGAWEDSLRLHYRALADRLRADGLTEPEILTPEGRAAYFPRYSPDGSVLAYAAGTGRDDPSTRLILPDGSRRTVVERTSLGPAAWTPDGRGLLFGELNFVDPYRIYSDLHRAGVAGGAERLTRAARLWEPDPHPDGARVVAVTSAGATNALVVRDLVTGETRVLTPPEPDVYWALPRWSPRGDRIAASRWAPGGHFDVVVLDSTGTVVRELTRDRAIDAAPAWSPDGRYVLFSSDRTGIPNLFAYDLRNDRLLQVTRVLTGAAQPDVSPDGRWIAFAYYRADGWHVARLPFDPEGWRPAPPVRPGAAPVDSLPSFAPVTAPDRRYSPWPSVAPAAWSVVVGGGKELGVGAGLAAGGADVIQRHLWAVEGLVYSDGARADAGGVYRYRGWGNPVLDLSASQRWSVRCRRGVVGCVQGVTDPLPTALLRRDREAEASLFWLRRRWRSSAWLRAGGEVDDLDFAWDDPAASGNRRLRRLPLDLGTSLEAGYSSARGYAFSLGPQEGFSVSSTLEGHRYTRPFADEERARGYLRLSGRGRGYHALSLPGFARHVLGLRADLGAETGSRSPGFGVGGAGGGPLPLSVDLDVFGRGLAFPIRGYPEGVQVGNRALTGSLEYRFPLLLVERGFRLVPVFLDRIWGDLFLDAGTAWCEAGAGAASCAPSDPRPLYAVGGELMVDLYLGFGTNLPLRLGAALPLVDARRHDPQLYVRVGRSF